MQKSTRRKLSHFSLFSGSALAMAFSMLSVIVLLIWWQQLISKNLETQYNFFRMEVVPDQETTPAVRQYIGRLDAKLAAELFPVGSRGIAVADARERIANRLANRKKMVFYEQSFFILLLLSGHIFFLYIYFRQRMRRKQTEETVLLATHELRQPLQSLTLALETLSSRAKGRTARAIESGMAELAKLATQTRWLAEIFADKQTADKTIQIPDFRKFLTDFLNAEFEKEQSSRLKIQSAVKEDVELRIPRQHLEFVLRNLVENALKYSEGPVAIEANISKKKFNICVKNSARSFSPNTFAKIGNLFYRSPESAVQNTPGFGLGLYLSGRILSRAGGKLELEHTVGNTIAKLRLSLK